MKPLLLASLATRQGHEEEFRAGQWPRVRREIEREGLVNPAPSAFFDHLAREGVLCMNSAWTFTRPEDLAGHLALWHFGTLALWHFGTLGDFGASRSLQVG